MNLRKTNWLHFCIGYPILFIIAYGLLLLFKCLTN